MAAAFADASSRWFAWWLRANGRYLIPSGTKDRTYAIALYLRNLAAIHFELGILAILLGSVLALIDIAGWSLLAHLGYTAPDLVFTAARYLPDWLPVIAFLLPLVAVVGCVIAIEYWCVPWLVRSGTISPGSVVPYWAGMAVLAAVLVAALPLVRSVPTDVGETARLVLWGVGFALVVTWLIAVPLAALVLLKTDPALTVAQRAELTRNGLTRALAVCLRAAALLALAGLVDRVAWFMAFEYRSLGRAGLLLAIAAAAIRAVLPLLSSLLPGRSSTGMLLWLGRLAGYAFAFTLCAWWVSIVDVAALGAAFQHAGPNFAEALAMVAVLGLPALGYALVTGRNIVFLNLSSLHSFYRARLARSYLGAANGKRFGQARGLDARNTVPDPMPSFPAKVSIGDPQPDDDIALADYRPQQHGGPVHLINACINQTRDPRGGLFNQDRRGLALTVASGGQMQVSREGWKGLDEGTPLTLSTWVAVSGAAVAPGLGSLTRGGIAALATFAGLRLGYWWDATTRIRGTTQKSAPLAKSIGLIRETFGVFRGTDRPDWFLTDGGHFENTGAYALLAERAEVIVLADCGADPKYAFGDVENLVRKARIDLQADILFHRPRQRPSPKSPAPTPLDAKYRLARHTPPDPDWPDVLDAFGSLNDLASPDSTACLALARIRYLGERRGDGILILVKPNVSSGLPVDLVNFKAENPDFPQQTTADQFFSEAQWESYSQLGYFLGAKLEREFIAAVVDPGCLWFERDEVSPFDVQKAEKRSADAGSPPARSRLPARIGATAITGIGLGAAATVGVSAWQAIDSVRTSYAKQTADERAALKELTDLWAKLAPATPAAARESKDNVQAIGALAAAIVRSADTLCPAHEAGWFQASPVAGSVYNTALKECGHLPAAGRPTSCTVLLEASHPSLQRPLPDCLVRIEGVSNAVPPPHYWVYDYSNDAPYARAHPCDLTAATRRKAENDYQTGKLRLEAPAADDASSNDLPPECRLDRTVPTEEAPLATDVASAASAALAPPPPPPPPISMQGVGPTKLTPTHPPASGPITAASAASAVVPVPPPPPPVAVPASTAISIPPDVCKGITVYTQIYGGQQRDEVRNYREPWRSLGASVPPVEDVYATARAAGRAQPLAVSRTTVRYHTAQGQACAEALASKLKPGTRVEPLSPRLKAVPGVVEVWIAPGPQASAAN